MKNLPNKADADNGSSLIRLSLRKPREWKVALTTSVSSPAVEAPDIQLYDAEEGSILLDTSKDMGGSFSKSKSASFTRRGVVNHDKEREGKKKSSLQNSRENSFSKYFLPASMRGMTVSSEDSKPGRSKSLSSREPPSSLVSPEDYTRPRTPVMVARRISLTKDSSSQTTCMDTPVSSTNGITTHHRKQHSDSSVLLGNWRRMKQNVSFGKVDTYDECKSHKVKVSKKGSGSRKSESYTSSPKIVITEVFSSNEDAKQCPVKPVTNQKPIQSRSRSGIPVRVKAGGDPITTNGPNYNIQRTRSTPTEQGGDPPTVNGPHYNIQRTRSTPNEQNSSRNSGRRSRMDLFMCENGGRHRFNVVRVEEPPEPPPLLPPSAFYSQYTPHHRSCDRENCPLDRYFGNHSVPPQLALKKTETARPRNDQKLYGVYKTSSVEDSHPNNSHRNPNRGRRDVEKRHSSGGKNRRKRMPSRNREEMMSSSSSECEEVHQKRHPPRRRRRSRNTKGDRLLGVNGQCVRTTLDAEELLRSSADVVNLHLQRNGVSASLPRHSVEDTEDTMGSNMSRHSGKGLTGRRSQSQGNLCNGKSPGVARFFSPCGRNNDSVGPRDRYKFCGSLPNHLDSKEHPLEEVCEPDDLTSYRNNNNVRKSDVVLRLQPLVPHGYKEPAGGAQDQGYASERSPEDELPPDLPPPETADQLTCPVHHPANKPLQDYPFLHKNSIFTVTVMKGTRGLGLSVTGGVDTQEPWPGLIRIKRLFPHQPAWQSGQLAQGDFLLAANNISLFRLTNYEALEVLRTTPAEVVLTVCRPPPELQVLSTPLPLPGDTAPLPPRRDPNSTSSLQLPLKRMESFGEFEITLKKVNGSLGFTLRKEDESVLGHYVRALVREPALSDGRVKPGDKIVAVNNVDMSPMSHEEAVLFLRQCGQEVQLKLYRDPAQTPVQALSPTEHHRTFKPILRKEAQDMLSDLAVKKSMSPKDSSSSSTLSSTGRNSSPRKRRLTKTPSPDLEAVRRESQLSWSEEVLERISPGTEGDRPRRPDSLNFTAERKPHFQFSAAGSCKTEESLNSLDSFDCGGSVTGADSEMGLGPLPTEPVSMPPLLTSASDTNVGFSYRNPAYRSANPAPSKSKSSLSEELPEGRSSDNDLTGGDGGVEGSKGLLKWKGVVFTPEDGAENEAGTSPDDSVSQITEVDNGSHQVVVVELNRGWSSRLGFSLKEEDHKTYISAIHPDSVASRDGRLKTGDQLIMVNDEGIDGMSTAEVIDLLRKIRGSICITVWRKL